MITKSDFEALENQIDVYAKQKQLTSEQGKTLLDEYLALIESYFCQINQIETINYDQLDTYHVVPINFQERFDYIHQRKHHFMGYRQMKTLISELIKMNAAYKARQSHQNRS
ncbi:YpoC family protein [Staphylococcus simulans]|uniref:YpoC family protein n=1 Tax=Staphylococcus simulans TaxID=1286 RepID=UPI00399AE9D5